MSVIGLNGCPTKCSLRSPMHSRSSACPSNLSSSSLRGNIEHKAVSSYSRSSSASYRKIYLRTKLNQVKCAMDSSYHGDFTNHQPVIFPRLHVRDPYKRLGISSEASEDEILAARNFLVQQYADHKPSVDAIESAHEKLIMQKYFEKRNPKLDLNKKAREIKQSRVLQAFANMFKTPPKMFIVKTALTFLLLGALTVLYPTEEGPTFQVFVSFIATTYFIYDRMRAKFKSLFFGILTFGLSWMIATFLMVSVIPPLPFIKGVRSFEVTSSLISYVFLFIASTYFV